MNKMFTEHIDTTIEVYIDDMLVKSVVAQHHIKHLEEVFQILRTYGMKLNPTKCTFRL